MDMVISCEKSFGLLRQAKVLGEDIRAVHTIVIAPLKHFGCPRRAPQEKVMDGFSVCSVEETELRMRVVNGRKF